MMTSNRPLEEWGKLIGDVPSATAILDRFLHRSELIQITGKSYRMENSNQRPKSTKAQTHRTGVCQALESRGRCETRARENKVGDQ